MDPIARFDVVVLGSVMHDLALKTRTYCAFPKSKHCLLPLCDESLKGCLLHTSQVDCLPIQYTHYSRLKTDTFLLQAQATPRSRSLPKASPPLLGNF